MTRWFRRDWRESRSDEYDSWGSATYLFETDDQGRATRQLETYVGGQRLKYTLDHPVDEFGMLSDQPLDLEDFAEFEIDEGTFTAAWDAGPAVNSPT